MNFLRDCTKIPLVVLLTSAFLLGIWSGYTFSGLPLTVSIISVVLFSAAAGLCCWQHRPLIAKIFFVLLFLLAGFLRSSYEVDRVRSDLALVKSSTAALSVICRVDEDPSIRPLKGRSAQYRFKVSSVRLEESGRFIRVPLIVNWYGDRGGLVKEAPQRGARWRFNGKVYLGKDRNGEPQLVMNSGESRSARLSAQGAEALALRVDAFRDDASKRIAIGIEDWADVADIHQAILLGAKDKISRSMRKIFSWSGTIHVFAISGLHIALIASVLVFFVSSCGVPRYYWVYVLAPLLLFYTVTTGLRPSAVRACLMAVFYFAAPMLGRRVNALSALTVTALVVHLFVPAYIFDLGSILSFSVMLGLIVLFKPVCELLKRAFRVEELEIQSALYQVSENSQKALRLKRCAAFLTFMADLMAVTISAWLASLPLSAYFFERITLGGLLANMVITPCALMVVTAGLLGFVASFFSIWLAACFNNAAAVFTTVMIKTAALISGCPYTHFEVHNWPLWGVWLWFAALLVLAWWLRCYLSRGGDGLNWIGEE